MEISLLDEVEGFLAQLTPPELAKTLRTIDLLEKFGALLGLPHSRHLKDGLLELRVRGKREIRIFYCFQSTSAVLLHACIKKTQTTPVKDIQLARARKSQLH